MGIKAAVEAYRESAYQNAEYDIERRIGAASIPVVGGLMGGIKQIGNGLWRPFKVAGAFIFGFDSNPESVQKTQIPEDLRNNKLGENLEKLRDYSRQAADARAEGVGNMLEFKITEGFRKFSAAKHVDTQSEHVLFPEEAAARMKAEIMAEMRLEQRRQQAMDNFASRLGKHEQETPAFLREILERGPGGGRGSAQNTGKGSTIDI